MQEDGDVDIIAAIDNASDAIQMEVTRAAEGVTAEIERASAWQRPDYTLEVLVRHLAYGKPGCDLAVMLLTAGGLVVGRLTNPVRWHAAVRGAADQGPGLYFGAEPWLVGDLPRLLDSSGMREIPWPERYETITRYFLLDATIQQLGAHRLARPPARPWIVQAQHVIGWTLGDGSRQPFTPPPPPSATG